MRNRTKSCPQKIKILIESETKISDIFDRKFSVPYFIHLGRAFIDPKDWCLERQIIKHRGIR